MSVKLDARQEMKEKRTKLRNKAEKKFLSLSLLILPPPWSRRAPTDPAENETRRFPLVLYSCLSWPVHVYSNVNVHMYNLDTYTIRQTERE